jgi:hypothetical protein
MVQVHSRPSLSKLVLSCFRQPGSYYLVVPSVGRSWTFSIGPDVFFHTDYLAMRAFYGQRCGTAVDLGLNLPGYTHAARQFKGSFHPSTSGIRRKSPPASTGMRIAETSSYGQRRNCGERQATPPTTNIFSSLPERYSEPCCGDSGRRRTDRVCGPRVSGSRQHRISWPARFEVLHASSFH